MRLSINQRGNKWSLCTLQKTGVGAAQARNDIEYDDPAKSPATLILLNLQINNDSDGPT